MTCNKKYIKRVIGVTRTFSWTITTNGEAQSLEDRNLTLLLIHPRGNAEELDFTTAGNVVSFTWQGDDQKELGQYSIILYENYGIANQRRVDIHYFLDLIPWSEKESGSYSDLTEESISLGSQEISGETVVVDNLTSTNPSFALSANMGRVLNETKMSASATLADIPGDPTHRTVTDAQMTSWSNKQSQLTGFKVMSIDEGHILFDNGNITGVYKGWGDDPQHVLHWPVTNDYLATTKGIENYLDYYNYYKKPQSGIPASDMTEAVQTSLGKADTAVQPSALNDYYNKTQVDTALGNKQNTLTFDSTPTANSNNPVTSQGIKTYVDSHSSGVTVDDALSTTSENPVQNKVVTAALNGKQATIDDLSTIRSGAAAGATAVQPATLQSEMAGKQDVITDLSTIRSGASAGATAVQPAAMNTALAAKQDTLTFDNAPTNGSNNPVKSGGIKTALDAKQETISTVNVTVDNNTGTPSGSASVSGGTLSLSFQNLKGATGAQGPQGIQGVQGIQGPQGPTGVSGDASSLAIIHGIDNTTTYTATDVCGADAAQTLLNLIEGGFYY